MNHVRLYQNELIHLGYGNPIWEPNPGTLYDCVRIGDVGYFQNDQFMPLFNILPLDDSNRTRRLPFPQPDFPALYLPENYPNTHDRNPLEAGVYALESSLTFSASVGVDSAGSVLHGESSLSFTNEKGAALILPSEACREDTLYDKLFKQHMLKYYRQWYTFALTECQRDIKLCDLILVTGCDLTRQWATATYFRSNREISAALGAQVAPVAEAKFSLSAGWSTTQAINTRRGPPLAFRQQPREDNDETRNDNGTLVNNQCVFLRAFYVKERLWGPQVMKAGAGYHDPGRHDPEEEGAEGVLADDDVTVESLVPSTQGESFMSVLLDYMLEESDADVVIANDSDLWPYLGKAANPQTLRDTLKGMSLIEVEDHVGSLKLVSVSEVTELPRKAFHQPSPIPGRVGSIVNATRVTQWLRKVSHLPSPMPHSHSTPGYQVSDPFFDAFDLHLATSSVAPDIQQSPLGFPESAVRPPPPPLDAESLSNWGRRRDSSLRRSLELHHSPTLPTSPSTRFPNSAVLSTGSEIFLSGASMDNSRAPRELPVPKNSFRRGRTRPKVQPLNWSSLKSFRKEKTKAPQLDNGQSATSSGSEPLILSTLGKGQQMDIDTFCNAYSLPDNILHLFHENAVTGTQMFSDITKTDLTQMGFKVGEIIELKQAVNKWAS